MMTLDAITQVDAATLRALETQALVLKRQVKAGVDPLNERHVERKTVVTARRSLDTFEEDQTDALPSADDEEEVDDTK